MSTPSAAGHLTLVPALKEELAKLGRDDIMIVVGGVIPPQDYDQLKASGAEAIFPPGTVIAEAAIRLASQNSGSGVDRTVHHRRHPALRLVDPTRPVLGRPDGKLGNTTRPCPTGNLGCRAKPCQTGAAVGRTRDPRTARGLDAVERPAYLPPASRSATAIAGGRMDWSESRARDDHDDCDRTAGDVRYARPGVALSSSHRSLRSMTSHPSPPELPLAASDALLPAVPWADLPHHAPDNPRWLWLARLYRNWQFG